MPRPPHAPWFAQPNNTWLSLQVMKLLSMKCSRISGTTAATQVKCILKKYCTQLNHCTKSLYKAKLTVIYLTGMRNMKEWFKSIWSNMVLCLPLSFTRRSASCLFLALHLLRSTHVCVCVCVSAGRTLRAVGSIRSIGSLCACRLSMRSLWYFLNSTAIHC
jgi:hypothetical protein